MWPIAGRLSAMMFLVGSGWLSLNGVRYVNGLSLTVLNRQDNQDKGYSRLDSDLYKGLPDNVREMAGYSTGVAVAFTTDSRYIKARWKCGYPSNGLNTSPLLQSGLDLYIRRDSTWVHAGVGLPSPEGETTLVEDMDGKEHECLLYLPLWNRVDSLFIGVDEKASITPSFPLREKKIVVVGSSITHGAAASRPGLAYPARMQRTTGWEFINLGFSGMCRLDDFYAEMIARSGADVVLIDAFSNPSPGQIEERLRLFVDRVVKKCAGKPVIFIQTEIRETGNFNLKKRDYEYRKRETAARIMEELISCGEYPTLYFINPGMPLGDSHEMTVDGTHPSDAGFEMIVNHLMPEIMKIIEQ